MKTAVYKARRGGGRDQNRTRQMPSVSAVAFTPWAPLNCSCASSSDTSEKPVVVDCCRLLSLTLVRLFWPSYPNSMPMHDRVLISPRRSSNGGSRHARRLHISMSRKVLNLKSIFYSSYSSRMRSTCSLSPASEAPHLNAESLRLVSRATGLRLVRTSHL